MMMMMRFREQAIPNNNVRQDDGDNTIRYFPSLSCCLSPIYTDTLLTCVFSRTHSQFRRSGTHYSHHLKSRLYTQSKDDDDDEDGSSVCCVVLRHHAKDFLSTVGPAIKASILCQVRSTST